jgi:hypothetical protein
MRARTRSMLGWPTAPAPGRAKMSGRAAIPLKYAAARSATGCFGLRDTAAKREGTGVQGGRVQIVLAAIVTHHLRRPVDAVKRGGVGKPEVGKGLRRRQGVTGRLGSGQGLAGDQVGGLQTADAPFQEREKGQQPCLPHARQASRGQGPAEWC